MSAIANKYTKGKKIINSDTHFGYFSFNSSTMGHLHNMKILYNN